MKKGFAERLDKSSIPFSTLEINGVKIALRIEIDSMDLSKARIESSHLSYTFPELTKHLNFNFKLDAKMRTNGRFSSASGLINSLTSAFEVNLNTANEVQDCIERVQSDIVEANNFLEASEKMPYPGIKELEDLQKELVTVKKKLTGSSDSQKRGSSTTALHEPREESTIELILDDNNIYENIDVLDLELVELQKRSAADIIDVKVVENSKNNEGENTLSAPANEVPNVTEKTDNIKEYDAVKLPQEADNQTTLDKSVEVTIEVPQKTEQSSSVKNSSQPHQLDLFAIDSFPKRIDSIYRIGNDGEVSCEALTKKSQRLLDNIIRAPENFKVREELRKEVIKFSSAETMRSFDKDTKKMEQKFIQDKSSFFRLNNISSDEVIESWKNEPYSEVIENLRGNISRCESKLRLRKDSSIEKQRDKLIIDLNKACKLREKYSRIATSEIKQAKTTGVKQGFLF